MVTLYNTETRQKEPITLREGEKKLKIYTCGPTVYNYAHIGNLRTYVFEDLLRRTLKFFGFEVEQVMNLTDVEDKTIRGAREKGCSLEAYTQVYKEAFFEDLRTLCIEEVEHTPSATAYIPQMVAMIQTLIDKGFAYQGKEGGIYYKISHFPRYGRLSHLELSSLKEGASERVSDDEYDKERPFDFVLWKPYDRERDGSLFWESPFGPGRPGWHIECSAMAMSLLGDTLDIHVGGVDNIFPHHENEIAQSEGCSGKCFVRHWIHVEHLIVEGRKMSKSAGNFYTLRDLLKKGYSGRELRYLLMSAHYRTQLNFTLEGAEAARNSLQRLADFISRLKEAAAPSGPSLSSLIEAARARFKAALADDLNLPLALAALFDSVKEVNRLIDQKKVTAEEGKKVLALFKESDQVLALLPLEEKRALPAKIKEALKKREEARAQKRWDEADQARHFIEEQGYMIKDTPQGPIVKRVSNPNSALLE